MRTRHAYAAHVSVYVACSRSAPESDGALREPRARDFAGRDFKRYLKLERGWAPSSVNLALAAIDHFNRFLGLGPAMVTRERLARSAPRTLDEQQQRDLLRAAESATARDRALVAAAAYQAATVRACRAGRRRRPHIRTQGRRDRRSGKGDMFREVALNATARDVVDAWREARTKIAADGETALWVGRGGHRLTARAVDLVVRKVAADAGLELSVHVLRHVHHQACARRQ